MLRHLSQILHVPLDEFWSPVVVVQHCEGMIHNRMVHLSYPYIYAEHGVDDAEDQAVDEMADCGSYSLLVVETIGFSAW